MVLVMNACLCLDLIWTLRDPFTKPESRYTLYIALVLTLPLVPFFFRHDVDIYQLVVLVYFLVYILIAFYSSIVAFVELRKPGMSSAARKMIINRHISYMVVNILCQSYNMFGQIILVQTPDATKADTWYFNIWATLFFGQGVWLNVVKLAEPSLLPAAIYYTTQMFKRTSTCRPKEEEDIRKNAWEGLCTIARIESTLKDNIAEGAEGLPSAMSYISIES